MRPTIINDNIINAFKKVAGNDINAIILTDEELVLEVNELLEEQDKFSYSAFKDWKAFAIGTKKDTSRENTVKYEELGSVIKKALLIQKRNLFNSLRNDDKAWQRYAWIIERKFADWNIKKLVDVTSGGKPIPILGNVYTNDSNKANNETNEED